MACFEVLVARDACQEKGVRRGSPRTLIALVVAFLIGCAVVLVAGASGCRRKPPRKKKPGARGQEVHQEPSVVQGGPCTTNDLPGCPKGGLLLGTDKDDWLSGKNGDDVIRGLGGSDIVLGGRRNDVIYLGPGDDGIQGSDHGYESAGDDVIYGGSGDDLLSRRQGRGRHVRWGWQRLARGRAG